jgi:hypothetical protein
LLTMTSLGAKLDTDDVHKAETVTTFVDAEAPEPKPPRENVTRGGAGQDHDTDIRCTVRHKKKNGRPAKCSSLANATAQLDTYPSPQGGR